jgi:hypothetical protein
VAESGSEQGRGERSGEQGRAVGAVIVLFASFVLVLVVLVVVVLLILFLIVFLFLIIVAEICPILHLLIRVSLQRICPCSIFLVLRPLILLRRQKISRLRPTGQALLRSFGDLAATELEVLEAIDIALRQGVVALDLDILVVLVGFEVGLVGVVELVRAGLAIECVFVIFFVLVAGFL